MKLGVIISAIFVLLLVAVGVLLFRGKPDRPTGAITDAILARHSLDPSLLNVAEPTEDGDAADGYLAAVDLFNDNQRALVGGTADQTVVRQIVDHLITAMRQRRTRHGFLDAQVPMTPAANPQYDEALTRIAQLVATYARQTDAARGLDAANALLTFGVRLFEHNDRLQPRFDGLSVMEEAVDAMDVLTTARVDNDGYLGGSTLAPITEIRNAWHTKRGLVHSPSPHAADLLQVAEHDADRSFRIEATLTLGIARFSSPSRGNVRVINDYLGRALAGDDPLIAVAAQVAQDFTKRQMHTMPMRQDHD
ncbi:MAG: hypothetical protein CMJ49_11185 [Planctomycetaceae bacterium]|nr:hypothetical protein [Planctomycetaceae bacterium]